MQQRWWCRFTAHTVSTVNKKERLEPIPAAVGREAGYAAGRLPAYAEHRSHEANSRKTSEGLNHMTSSNCFSPGKVLVLYRVSHIIHRPTSRLFKDFRDSWWYKRVIFQPTELPLSLPLVLQWGPLCLIYSTQNVCNIIYITHVACIVKD